MKWLNQIRLVFFMSFALLPLLAGLAYALGQSLGMIGLMSPGFTLDYWQRATIDGIWLESMLFSIGIATVSLIIASSIAIILSIQQAKSLVRGEIQFFFYLPLAVPAIVAGFFSFQLLSGSGWIARVFYALAWIQEPRDFPEFIQDPWAIGIVLTHTMMAIPFFTLLFFNLYQSERLEEMGKVAASLGASAQQIAYRVYFPILLRGAYPVLIMYWIFILGSYEIPLLLGRQSPRMISILTVDKLQGFDLSERPLAYTYAFMYAGFILGFLVFLLFRKNTYANP